ncbi:hypothetical protein E3N88_14636 [Mikania micrantha]|uniref:Translation initiation factor eIF2B subunit delta n=1 Tax=Mikania micrantha TaxID=192012 RepID=A0A5N6P4K8_9ASTR|nr:hypothetical protein E3N88_14636 [Mikania micrantha]
MSVRKVGFFPPERTQSAGSSATRSAIVGPTASQLQADMSDSFSASATRSSSSRIVLDTWLLVAFAYWMKRDSFGALITSDLRATGGHDLAQSIEASNDEAEGPSQKSLNLLKTITTKADRRALQEAQRAAKASASDPSQTSKPVKQANQKKAVYSSVVHEKKCKPPGNDKKKNLQFDDETRVENVNKRSVAKQTEARNGVDLFRHLPQERRTQLSDLGSLFFRIDDVHPAVYKVGLHLAAGDINTCCIPMLQAFQKVIEDHSTQPDGILTMDLTAKIITSVSFLTECRPLSISMENANRFLNSCIRNINLAKTDTEAKTSLCSDIDHYIQTKIVLAEKQIVIHAVTKICDGDVILTYGSSSLIEMIMLHAHELKRQFRVVIVDSRPNLEAQRLLLYSTVGTACIAMVAHAYRLPVLVCCESYKFQERAQLDSICFNELGDPDVISKVPGRKKSCLDDWAKKKNLQLLNLVYDVTPADYVSTIVTEYGMVSMDLE